MTDSKDAVGKCPFCDAVLEEGCVMGQMGLNGAFRWFAGGPTALKNMFGGMSVNSEELGIFGILKGPYMTGSRCKSCRKVFLSY
jgi:hypothetical protein